MIKAGIIGSTGYAGQEIVRILLGHKDVEIVWYGSRSFIDKKYYEVFGNMFQIVDATCLGENMDELAEKVDVIFTATPQGLCSSLVNEDILSKVKIIDLSADFRIKDVATYEKWYKIEHKSPEFIDEAGVSSGSGVWIGGNQSEGYSVCKTSGKSGLLYNLLHSFLISACKREADRSEYDHCRC